MNLDDVLRDYARQDLQRFCPAAHYWLRDHNPIADRELIEPLLSKPVQFGLTPRERVAAEALGDLTTYIIRSRAIFEEANPMLGFGDTTTAPGMTFEKEREIYDRREVFRRSALVYARMLGDTQLIEHYQTPVPAPTQTAVEPAEASPPSPAPMVAGSATGEVRDWKNIVRAEAWEQWVKTLAENGTPTLESVAKHLAVWCVTNEINGNLGKPPMAGYIQTHVICGKYWQPPRSMTRAAAKKHLEQKEHAKQPN